jgi:hypothetical protein
MKYLFLLLVSLSALAETRQKIVVIDTGVSIRVSMKPYMCKDGKQTTYGLWIDDHGHGSNVIDLIGSRIDHKKLCIVSIKTKWRNLSPEQAAIEAIVSIKKAALFKPIAVNISMDGNIRSDEEKEEFRKLLKSGSKIITAAGNHHLNLDKDCSEFPACYLKEIKQDTEFTDTSNFFVVGASDVSASSYGTVVTVRTLGLKQGIPEMTGTSQAAANFTGKLFSR